MQRAPAWKSGGVFPLKPTFYAGDISRERRFFMRNAKVQWLVKMAVLAALSLALMYVVRFPFPAAPYLEYDLSLIHI